MPVRTYNVSFDARILQRGFWIYVWRVRSRRRQLLYVGRTGDNSSPFAIPPYQRMGQHLGNNENQNALRKHLKKKYNLRPEDCKSFDLIMYGPIFAEVTGKVDSDRKILMAKHIPIRNCVGALEKALADDLANAGYEVMNTVRWKPARDDHIWKKVRRAFARHFPKLRKRLKRS